MFGDVADGIVDQDRSEIHKTGAFLLKQTFNLYESGNLLALWAKNQWVPWQRDERGQAKE